MISNLERDLQKKCLRWVRSLSKVWYLKVVGNAVQASGVPDILLCIKGKFIAIELKRPDGTGVLSDIQQANIERIREAGGQAYVVDSFEEFKRIIEENI